VTEENAETVVCGVPLALRPEYQTVVVLRYFVQMSVAEMRGLKTALRFTVRDAYFDKANPEAGVWGTLQYQLADGRTVGAKEQLPPEIISEDGTQVVMPDMEAPITIEGAEGASD
jgi:hypothetical protein